jgi:4-amino-4-deoxy-L-arabinose transferase-like glycosyltransferase
MVREAAPPRAVWIVLAGVLSLAAALRVVGASYGLPYPLLNPDEASIVPRAWAIGNGDGLDPGWYDYPSLLMGLLAPVQALFAEPSYGAARAVAIAFGLAGVGAAWWLGRVAYGTGAALVGAAAVAVATTHVAYSRVAVTDVPLALGVTAALALALSGRVELAGLVAGLAASAKYPGVLLAVPLVVAAWGAWARLGRALLLAVAAFALTSPFVLLHAGEAWEDFTRVSRVARVGWLGFEDDPATPLAFLDRAWGALGPAVAVMLAAVVVALVRRSRADVVLLSFAVVWVVQLLPVEAHYDRYLLPVVPVLAVLAGSTRVLTSLALVALAVPLWWSAGDAVELTRTDTRLRADGWIAAHVPAGDRVAADPSTLPLPGREVIRLELPGPAFPTDPNRDLDVLRRRGVEWVLVSGAVTDRVRAAAARYPREIAFYDALDALPAAFSARPVDALGGPWVKVVRISQG